MNEHTHPRSNEKEHHAELLVGAKIFFLSSEGLSAGFYVGAITLANGEKVALISPTPQQHPQELCAAYQRHSHEQAGNAVMYSPTDRRIDPTTLNGLHTESLEKTKILNPSRASIIADLKKWTADKMPYVTAQKLIPEDIQEHATIQKLLTELNTDTLTQEQYAILHRFFSKRVRSRLTQAQHHALSHLGGWQYAGTALMHIEREISADQQAIEEYIASLEQDFASYNASIHGLRSLTPAQRLQHTVMRSAIQTAKNETPKTLASRVADRDIVLSILGKLLVTADWYHATQDTQN